MSVRDHVTRRLVEAGGRLRVRSALNPVLWLCAVVSGPVLISAPFYKSEPPAWLIVAGLVPVAVAAIGFLFLLLVDRDKLQSEDYQIRKRSLELIYAKGARFPINPATIEHIANPQTRQIDAGNGDDQ